MPASSPDSTAFASNKSHRYLDWKAPAEDSQVLIWPEPRELLDDALTNQKLLRGAHAARIQNVPLPELRREHRNWIGHSDDDRPIIATGHQTELYHPGVWVKNTLIDTVAKKLNGAAYHVAVDIDAPKHLNLRWPSESLPITDDPSIASAAWCGLLEAPSPAHVQRISDAAERAAPVLGAPPALAEVLLSLRRLALGDPPPNLSAAITNAVHELDWSLGLRHHALLLSPVLSGQAYLALVHHVMARAGQFARDYNAALAQFRREHHTHSPTRPMPDLFISGDVAESIEAPF